MGTASTAFEGGDPHEAALVKELNEFLEGSRQLSDDKKKGLEQAFRAAIDKAIFGTGADSADANTRANVRKAIQGQVMNTMLREYEKWKNDGEVESKWPFPKKPTRNP